MQAKHAIPFLILILFIAAVPRLPKVAAFTPSHGDFFTYHEVTNLGSGTGAYTGYTESMTVDGIENMTAVNGDNVTAIYAYTYQWSNSSGSTENGQKSGAFTFSRTSFLYLNATDDQIGYVNPTVWFAMNNSLSVGSTFYILNTKMTIISKNESYPIQSPAIADLFRSGNGYLSSIHAQGSSSYHRNDVYGQFNAAYTWNAYFDPKSGYILGYLYTEHDTNSSGDGFDYTENLYVTSTSYPLTGATGPFNLATTLPLTDIFYIIIAAGVVITVAVFVVMRRRGRL